MIKSKASNFGILVVKLALKNLRCQISQLDAELSTGQQISLDKAAYRDFQYLYGHKPKVENRKSPGQVGNIEVDIGAEEEAEWYATDTESVSSVDSLASAILFQIILTTFPLFNQASQ